jgi:hypothetical protein
MSFIEEERTQKLGNGKAARYLEIAFADRQSNIRRLHVPSDGDEHTTEPSTFATERFDYSSQLGGWSLRDHDYLLEPVVALELIMLEDILDALFGEEPGAAEEFPLQIPQGFGNVVCSNVHNMRKQRHTFDHIGTAEKDHAKIIW